MEYPKHDYVMEKSGLRNECAYKPGADFSQCPHVQEGPRVCDNRKPYDNIIDCIGWTPMVRINNITKKEGIKCQLYAKCEFMNPGGSVKDRIGRRMILDAEKQGKIKPGESTLIEPTSGNTGTGLAMVAAVKGYNMVFTLPEKNSMEKQDMLKGLGADVIATPNVPVMHQDSHVGTAYRLSKSLENTYMFDQIA